MERKGPYRVIFVSSRYKSELRMTLSIGADEEQVIDLDFRDADAVINVNKEEMLYRII